MSLSPPLVSIGIPTYCGAKNIAETIESVLSQSITDFELIIIDDNSSDSTADIVARYADPRIRFMRNEKNLGPQGNWNRCLSESRGKYFKLLPQDDLLAPQCLEKQIAVLEADLQESLALVFCSRKITLPDGRCVTQRGYSRGRAGRISGRVLISHCIRRGTNLIGEPGSGLCRRALAQRIGGYDASNPYVVDLDYWLRLLVHGDGFYLDEPLTTFRVSKGSWSFAIGNNQSRDFSGLISRIATLPQYSVSRFDQASGHIMAKINNLLRMLFYRFFLS